MNIQSIDTINHSFFCEIKEEVKDSSEDIQNPVNGCYTYIPPSILERLPFEPSDAAFLAEKLSGHFLIQSFQCSYLQNPIDFKRFVGQRLINSIYSDIRLSKELNICLTTEVMEDGSGDFFNLISAAKTLKMIYPQCHIRMIYHHSKSLPELNWENYGLKKQDVLGLFDKTSSLFYGLLPEFSELTSTFLDALNNDTHPLHFKTTEFIEFAKNKADLNIVLPHPLVHNETKQFYQMIGKELIYINENGMSVLPFSGSRYSMGLAHTDQGIYIDSPLNLFDIKESNLNLEKPFHFIYVHDVEKILSFMKVILQIQNIKHYQFVIDYKILNSDRLKFINMFEKYEIEELKLIKDDKETIVWKNAHETGKKITLLDPFPLHNAEFIQYIKESERVVGCTGDSSFSQVIAAGKIPFYELAIHKKLFWKSIIDLVRYCLGEESTFFKYLEASQKTNFSEEIAKLLRNNEIYDEIEILKDFIKNFYNFEKKFIALVNHHFLVNAYPTIVEFESALINEFINDQITAKQLYEQAKERVSEWIT